MALDITILLLVVLVASFLQASTGYGFSIIGTPFLLLIYPLYTAIQINIILSIFLSAMMFVSVKKEIDRQLVSKLIKGSIIGSIGGIIIYLTVNVQWLKISVGLLILLLTILLTFNFTIQRSAKRDVAIGGISGLLTTSIGVPGPPLLLYFTSASIDRFILRSTTLAYYLFIYSISLLMQLIFGETNQIIWIHSFIAIPALVGGKLLGQLFIRWVSQRTFRLITYIILVFTGIYLVVSSI